MRNPAAQGRRDATHAEVVKAYEDAYCNVIDLSHVGFGCPDVLIALSGGCWLREIKTERGHMEASQKRFGETWRGPKIQLVRSSADAINDALNLRQNISRSIYGQKA